MTETIEFQSRVGDDGILDLHVPLGKMGAGADVVVTIRRVHIKPELTIAADRHRILEETYGSYGRLDLERAPQGEFETRERIE